MKTTCPDTPRQGKCLMHSHPLRTFGISLIAGMMISGAAQGILVGFEGTPDSTPVSMTFTRDVTFTVTNAVSTFFYFVIDELFLAPDGDATGISSFSSQLSFSINGETPFNIDRWVDNMNTSINDITPGDSYFYNNVDSFSLSAGDVVTLHAGTLTSSIAPGYDFNLGANGNYTLFLVDDSGTRISSDAIPEPASALLLSLGATILFVVRRRFPSWVRFGRERA